MQLDPSLLPYRYLLSPTLDTATFDTKFLHDELSERVADVASPAADLLNDLLPRDPTMEVLKLAQRWTPAKAPSVQDGVWMSPHDEALLLVQTRGAAFDPGAQAAAIADLEAKFHALPECRRRRNSRSAVRATSVRNSPRRRAAKPSA